MDDYQKNIGRLKIGNNQWNFHQEFKSFATLENQELLFSLNISSLSADIQIAFLFHHMVRKIMLNYWFYNEISPFQANFEDIFNKLGKILIRKGLIVQILSSPPFYRLLNYVQNSFYHLYVYIEISPFSNTDNKGFVV